ncbi:MAG: retron St85 family RNA-directed DNA polymerase [Proteobacteria bacterium]|nr:retron St85 family RNA-directed DNA polymerase [Pseudomonadota bacterium]
MSEELNIPVDSLSDTIEQSRSFVKRIKINKKSGGERIVYQPARKIKVIQYWLMRTIFSKITIHSASMAYRKEGSIKENALKHSNGGYFLKLDFKDFFPSIKFSDLNKSIIAFRKNNNAIFKYTKADQELIRRVCFYKNDKLPIGYPSSPIISNIVMYKFDIRVTDEMPKFRKYGNVVYTRYADDMIFSTDRKGGCEKIFSFLSVLINSWSTPSLLLNEAKTRFVSSSGGTAIVTGLRICYDGHITLHRHYKDIVRLLLSLYKKGNLKEEDVYVLKGHLSYIQNVDSVFYTKICKKYFDIIDEIKTK